jgi:hypothetical protein
MDELFIITYCINIKGIMHIKFVEKIKTHILCSKFISENRAFYELM